jgi:hypothetical protein
MFAILDNVTAPLAIVADAPDAVTSPVVIGTWKSVPAVAALIPVPFPLSIPVTLVDIVIAGVVVAVATV